MVELDLIGKMEMFCFMPCLMKSVEELNGTLAIFLLSLRSRLTFRSEKINLLYVL